MSSKWWFCLLLAASFSVGPVFGDDRVDQLPEDDRLWLEEEVVYIITPLEKEVYLSLETQQERELFRDAFWERRDPDPATLVNEFQEEHYRRLEFAIRTLGREAPEPGWKTDRGRYYIILGEPEEIQRYYGENEVVECELWLYTGDTKLGLPPRFNLLFFRENGIGAYQLYHPFSDGPEALLNVGMGEYRANQNMAVDVLEMVSIDLARASLTIDLTDPVGDMLSGRNTRDPTLLQVRPSMGVDRDIVSIEESPQRQVDTDYLEGYTKYGKRVSSEYSFKYIPSNHAFAVLTGPQDTQFVHYSIEIEPENFSMESNDAGTTFYTTLEVSVEVRDKEGALLAVTQNQPFLQISVADLERAQAYPFAYRDSFPVLPGLYDVSVIVKNRATKQYTVAETDLMVPAPPAENVPVIGDIVLGYAIEKLTSTPGEFSTFEVDGIAIQPAPGGVFAIGANVEILTQLYGASNEDRLRVRLMTEPDDDSTSVQVLEKEMKVSDYFGGAATISLVLEKVAGGRYSVVTELVDPSDVVRASRSRLLLVSPRTSIPRPSFVYRHSFNVDIPGLLSMTMGEQLMIRGRIPEAEALLREAVAENNPQLPMAKWKLASAVLFERKADEALSLLQPLEGEFPDQVEVVEGLGFAYYIKEDYAQAAPYLERAKGLRPPDTSLLNALGDSYQHLENAEKAREMFELSLELNPSQEGVKQRIASLGVN